MEKLIPALMLIVMAAGIGAVIRERLMRELREMNELISDLKLIQPRIRWEQKPLKELIAHLSRFGNLSSLWGEMLELLKEGEDIEKAVSAIEKRFMLRENFRNELRAYFISFGMGNASVEAEKLAELIDKLTQNECAYRAEREKKMKLVFPLSVMAGAAAALLTL